MKRSTPGFRVAVVGASSLLGKELLAVLEERQFPVAQLITLGGEADEPELPILDLGSVTRDPGHELAEAPPDPVNLMTAQADIIFLAERSGQELSLDTASGHAGPVVIDLGDISKAGAAAGPVRAPDEVLSIPSLERELASEGRIRESKRYVSPHPVAIVISSLLLRLAARLPIRAAIALVLGPASEIGARGVEELQKQTVNLLSFQKIPTSIFGAQLAFNVLPRLGRIRRGGSEPYRDLLTDLEGRVRTQLRTYLAGRTPLPALRVIQVPVFYALTVSLYVETEQPVSRESIGQALAGGRVRVRRFSERAPSQVDVTGTGDILVDAITVDAEHAGGIWLWALGDNLRLAAVNAVEIAESAKQLGLPLKP